MNAQAPNPFSKTDLISPKTFRRMSPDRPFEMTELIDSPFRTEGTLRRNVVLNSAMLEQSKAFTRPGRWLLFRCLRNVLVVSFLSDGRFDDLVRLDGFRASAAFRKQERQQLLQRSGVGGVPEETALAAHIDHAFVLQLLQVMRKIRSADSQFRLDLSGDHAFRMRGEQKLRDAEA